MNVTEDLKIQNRVSIIIAVAGGLVILINLFRNLFIRHRSLLDTLLHNQTVSLLFMFSLIMFLTRKSKSAFVRYLQIFVFLANAALAIMDEYDAFHGMGFVILAILLAHRYGFFNRHPRIKLIILAVFTMTFIELSINAAGEDHVGSSIDILIYIVFFLTLIYLIYKSEIDHFLRLEKVLSETISSMENEKSVLEKEIMIYSGEILKRESRIRELEMEISSSVDHGQPIRLKEDFGITGREEDVIREFCLNPQLTTSELADRLHMSFGTIKRHFNSIFKKLKVRSRSELLDRCKWNFRQE